MATTETLVVFGSQGLFLFGLAVSLDIPMMPDGNARARIAAFLATQVNVADERFVNRFGKWVGDSSVPWASPQESAS